VSVNNPNPIILNSHQAADPLGVQQEIFETASAAAGADSRTAQSQPARDRAAAGTEGYGVTTSATPEDTRAGCALITELESYIRSYVTLVETSYALVIALWLAVTHAWIAFDSLPYLVVTSTTKRSGKTRLLELMSFIASKSRLLANISPAALYRTVDAEKPTLLIDEAEMFTSAKGEYRGLLNTGYRRGQTVKRHDGDYETYCPKAFALIGDIHDTLRDRSIVVAMRRGKPVRRFVYATAKEQGASLREKLSAAISSKAQEIAEAVDGFEGLPFLTDRDEEIWTPLFILCRLLCPNRVADLTSAAADMSAAKTAKPRKYIELGEEEDRAQEQEYAIRLLRDMVVVSAVRDQITTQEAIAKLREIPTSPWRRFQGEGLKDGIEGAMVVSRILSQFCVKPSTIRIAPKNLGTGSTAKGYKRRALLKALHKLEQADRAGALEPARLTRIGGDSDMPEESIEHGAHTVKPSLTDPAALPSKRSGNGLDYRGILIDLLDQVEKLGPRLPVELHVKCKQYRTTIGLPPNVVSDPNWNSKVEQEETANDNLNDLPLPNAAISAKAVTDGDQEPETDLEEASSTAIEADEYLHAEPVLEADKRYFVRHGSRNELEEMIYGGRDGNRYVFISTGKRTGYALLAKNAAKVWEQDEHGELKPVKIPNKRVFIKKVQ
jgi:hypothetical protein